jgi:sortase B
MERVWKWAAKLAHGGNRLLNAVIAVLLIVALLYGGFGLWDTWNIYNKAGLDSDLLKYKPTATGEDAPNPSLSDLQKINPDVCAWLTVDDTNIDYPVVQGKTNLEYVNQAVDKSFSLSGSLFLDCSNSRDFSDRFSLIYGHHMDADKMFGEVPYFMESDYFESHKTGTVFTLEHTFYIKWFACVKTDAFDTKIYNPTDYTDSTTVSGLLDYVKSIATQYRDNVVKSSDRILALSTCETASTNGRIILFGKLS